jgi:hypothetical protein
MDRRSGRPLLRRLVRARRGRRSRRRRVEVADIEKSSSLPADIDCTGAAVSVTCTEAMLSLLDLPPGSRFIYAPDYLDMWQDPSLLDV